MTKETSENKGTKKETFLQGIITLIFSQVLIKLLGLLYTLYLTNRSGFGDRGNGIVAAGYHLCNVTYYFFDRSSKCNIKISV